MSTLTLSFTIVVIILTVLMIVIYSVKLHYIFKYISNYTHRPGKIAWLGAIYPVKVNIFANNGKKNLHLLIVHCSWVLDWPLRTKSNDRYSNFYIAVRKKQLSSCFVRFEIKLFIDTWPDVCLCT